MFNILTRKKQASLQSRIDELTKENAKLQADIAAGDGSHIRIALYLKKLQEAEDLVAQQKQDIERFTAEIAELKKNEKSAMQHALDIVASQGVPNVRIESDGSDGRHRAIPGVTIRAKV